MVVAGHSRFRCWTGSALLAAWAAGIMAPGGRPARAEAITVQLSSGRQLTAQVDPRTSEQQLWLRFGSDPATILRPVEWDRVAAAWQDGRALSIGELKRQGAEPRRVRAGHPEGAEEAERSGSGQASVADRVGGRDGAGGEQLPAGALAVYRLGDSSLDPRTAAVHFDTYLVNWDADVEPDGLVVHLFPLNGSGHGVAVHGSLQVELMAPVATSFDAVPRGRGWQMRRIGYWSRQVDPVDFGASGAVYRLSFQAQDPQFDRAIDRYGLVHVRLAVPGEGVFDHSEDAVRIRPFSPVRDELERLEGRRFFPHERIGYGRR